MKKIIIVIISIFLALTPIYAQNKILDKPTEEMTIDDIVKISYEDLSKLPIEDLMAIAKIIGVSSDELKTMMLDMQVTTASKKAENVFDSPLSITAITKEQIQNSGCSSIPELFRMVPGMIVREKTNGNYDIHIRGFDYLPQESFINFSANSLTLVMVNNRPIYNHMNGGTFWETLPISLVDIERIDIVRGTTSALYGPNAVTGVINIITKESDFNDSKEINFQGNIRYGMHKTKQGALRIDGNLSNKLSFNISGNYGQRYRTQRNIYNSILGKYMNPLDIENFGKEGKYFEGNKDIENIDLDKSQEKYGIIGSLNYQNTDKDLFLSMSGGYQDSKIATMFVETYVHQMSFRYSKTWFTDFDLKWKHLTTKISYNYGNQNLSAGMVRPVISFDMATFNANMDYNIKITEKLSVRPGINVENTSNDNTEKVIEMKEKYKGVAGLFPEKVSLLSLGGNIKLDYNPTDKIKLMAAISSQRYLKEEISTLGYSFVASYKPNDNHLLRLVIGRANKAPFLGSMKADFEAALQTAAQTIPMLQRMVANSTNPIIKEGLNKLVAGYSLLPPETQVLFCHYLGNKDLNLLTSDMTEIGWRWKISDKLQFQTDLFYCNTHNYDDISFDGDPVPSQTKKVEILEGLQEIPLLDMQATFKNLDIKAHQTGITAIIDYKPLSNLYINAYTTTQRTFVYNKKTEKTNINRWTPQFYGGLIINYSPIEKLSIFSNLYYSTEQLFRHDVVMEDKSNGQELLKASCGININVSYKFFKNNTIFIGARNLTTSNHEFGFADEMKPMIIGGLNINF